MFGKNKKAAQHLIPGDIVVIAGVEMVVVTNDPNTFGRALRDITLDPDPDSTTAETWERRVSLYIPSYLTVTHK